MKSNIQKLDLLIFNLISLRMISVNLIKFLWNECPVEILRAKDLKTDGVFYWYIKPCKPFNINISKHTKN